MHGHGTKLIPHHETDFGKYWPSGTGGSEVGDYRGVYGIGMEVVPRQETDFGRYWPGG